MQGIVIFKEGGIKRIAMNYLDLFSGIGGFHEGLNQAGFKFDWTGYSEISEYAKQIYRKHFPEAEDLGDVRTIRTDRLPKINLITFGFPCQDLSTAGKRAGLAGERSGLFNEAIRIVRDAKPDYFIFENVKGLFSSNSGRDFEYILRTIADIGYDGQWQLLNTRWVLPQNRERIYFVGNFRGRGKRRPEIFPIGEGIGISGKKNGGKSGEGKRISSAIDSRYGSIRNAGETYIEVIDAYNARKTEIPTAIRQNMHMGGALLKIGIIKKDAQGQRVYDINGIACQLTAMGGGWGAKTGLYEIKKHKGIRRLTPLECERLQGFKGGWTKDISDAQRYKCLGNAVTVPIVKLIAEKLLNEPINPL